MTTHRIDISALDSRQRAELFGEFQKNLRDLEQWFSVRCRQQGSELSLVGATADVAKAFDCLERFVAYATQGVLTERKVAETLMMCKNRTDPSELKASVKLKKTLILPKSRQQNAYLEAISRYDINFGIGPAGTGKTWLAVAKAVEALEQEQVSRLVLTRPAVEAGEKLGFLPGDLAQKVDPYLRPVYDALY